MHIVGVTKQSFESQVWAKSVVSHLKPKLLVLGGVSDNYLQFMEWRMKLRNKYEHPITRSDKMVCK